MMMMRGTSSNSAKDAAVDSKSRHLNTLAAHKVYS